MPDETGLTRREKYEALADGLDDETISHLNIETPPVIIPEVGQYIWDWYFAISRRLHRVINGILAPIPPTEFQAWANLTKTIVRANEYDILFAMDDAYRAIISEELALYRERLLETPPKPKGKENG